MNREIKFEYGFSCDDGSIVKKKYYLSEIPNISKLCDVWNMLPIAYVRQFTGRQDAEINGEDVYEGDVLKNSDTGLLQVVFWNEDEASWFCRYVNDENRIVSLADSLGNLNKKVGNIHENPELLTANTNS